MTDFAETKTLFHLPEGVVYLDGNSLGPLPKSAPARIAQAVEAEWGAELIGGWTKCGWMDQPTALGDRIGRLIGAAPGTTTIGDTLSIKVFQALSAALALRPDRRIVLTDMGNFPTDLYMAQSLLDALGQGHVLKAVAPEEVADHLGEDVAVLMLTQVDYRTGRRHDMAGLTAAAHEKGALTVWDLAHSAGAIAVNMIGTGADFCVGCTYKFLNAGPGAPAFISVAPQHAEKTEPILAGWLGHAAPFAFEPAYRAGLGIERFRVGTPPVLQMAALDAALDIWDGVDLAALEEKAATLGNLFINEVEARCPDLTLASPRDARHRGSQVSFRHPDGYPIMQALIADGVVGDFRAPDILRFGITPLYLDEADIRTATERIETVMKTRAYDLPEHREVKAVT
ncbi:kynureninase [Aestuariibius sp. 2305UL40-4]|uniref:kynureninase n=1 Tax=Aestuariibius violaceus TaxID=3234132 RepID=UPI00345E65FD